MRSTFAVLMLFAVVAATSAFALARGVPPDNQPTAVERVMVTPDAPMVTSVPPLMVGYDVIQNLSESKTIKPSVTTERRRQSTTGAWRRDLRGPEIVMLT